MKNRVRISHDMKNVLIAAVAFPILSLLIISAPKGLFPNYNLLGISGRFLSPMAFIFVNTGACYISGVGFFYGTFIKNDRCSLADHYNAKLLVITAVFFLHIWIFLFLFSMALVVSLVCIFLSMLFSLLAVALLSKTGRLPFFAALVLSIWIIYLLFLNVGILFI